MTNFILGTAGHIDHGKTALVKALTGIDCDTHPEEKQRGITINLGFSHLTVPGGESIGIVDVPGHFDFVNTMIAGAHGIDILMLVIAADSGIMPQTIEHLQIAESLGIRTGFVVLTKKDLVDGESIEIIEYEIKDFLKNTFLNNCKIIRTSAITGEGIEKIKNYLKELIGSLSKKNSSKMFRMYIDRIFSVPGFGTVVTGSALGGVIKKDDMLFLLPPNKELRIRRIERHGKEVEKISAGNRVSLNLTGLNKEEFTKGMLLSDRVIKPTTMVDVRLSLFKDSNAIGTWSDTIFLTGTYKNQAKMHLIDTDKAAAGDSVIAQLLLTNPCTVMRGDRFIIRSTSGLQTLGGGEVIDPFPLHHKRRTEKIVKQLQKVAVGNAVEFIFSEVRKRRKPISLGNISDEIAIEKVDVSDFSYLPEDISCIKASGDTSLMLKSVKEKVIAEVLKNVGNFHKRNPLLEKGRTIEELCGVVAKNSNQISENVLKLILQELEVEKKLKHINNSWLLYSHSVKLNEKETEQIDYIEEYFKKSDMHTPLMSELILAAKRKGIDEKMLTQILNLLTDDNKLTRIEEYYLHSSIVNECKIKLLSDLNNNPDGITVAEFRDLIKGNRKICLLLLNHFDTQGLTYRDGDLRKITEKGKNYLIDNG